MEAEPVIVECAHLGRPDLATIDALARIRLAARRTGRRLRLVNPTPPLLDLIWLCGLGGELRVEVRRQPEKREQPGRVEKESELADPPL